MSSASTTDFLSNYLHSLSEETADAKSGPRYGLDRIIFQLELERGNTPIRIPYFREGQDKLPTPIKENEHGVDFAFLTPDQKTLKIFVLKGERLTSKTFTSARTTNDLQRAAFPDLRDERLATVEEVILILVYNKDDDEEGIEDYDRLCQGLGTKVGDHATRSFDRWNLTKITEFVEAELLGPSLLPENLYRKFTYLCGQLEEFDATSRYWSELLIPEWKKFLSTVLSDPVSERSMRMVPVILIILQNHAKKDNQGNLTGGAEIGWIDLMEWAVLAMWEAGKRISKKDQKNIGQVVIDVTVKFYLDTLHKFYQKNAKHLAAEDSLTITGGLVDDAASSYMAHWHLGRMGLLAMMLQEWSTNIQDKNFAKDLRESLIEVSDWIIAFHKANTACYRPMLDIQHIEIFLTWRALASIGRSVEIDEWLNKMLIRLRGRQFKKSELPWIDHRNSWETLFESLVDLEQDRPESQPSYLLLMLAEILSLCSEEFGSQIFREHVVSLTRSSQEPTNFTSIELMGWIPPASWFDDILAGPVSSGHGVPVQLDFESPEQNIRDYIKVSQMPEEIVAQATGLPSIYVLACLKNQSPLPP
ncbi:MAG: hypothetical protein ACK57I_03435, partial [Akkermansiaceae bacterium]